MKYAIMILSLLNGVRIFPLWILWKVRLYIKDKNAYKFKEDLRMGQINLKREKNFSFFTICLLKPQYKSLLYVRLGRISYPLKYICGSYPITIDSKHNMPLGKGVWMEHPHGTHLHAKSIGDYLTIKHNVTIGMNHNELPIIGNHVFCGVGSCILGGIRIGDNVKIGANCVVTKDVPDNCTVIGNPAVIVKKDGQKVHIPL